MAVDGVARSVTAHAVLAEHAIGAAGAVATLDTTDIGAAVAEFRDEPRIVFFERFGQLSELVFVGHVIPFHNSIDTFRARERKLEVQTGAYMSTGNPGLIGKAIRIKGELHGEEDLIIEGKVEGTIALKKNHLILERSAVIAASVEVENITIKGQMNGNTSASNRVEITSDAKVVGDIKAPRIVMAEGARFRGQVDMDVKLPPGV